MLNETTSKQLRDIIQEEIQNIMEKLTAHKLDTDAKGVTTHTLKNKEDRNIGVMRSAETPDGKLKQAYGRIRPTAPLKNDAVEETVKAPPSGDEQSPDKEPENTPRKKKDGRSQEDKSRDMGQIEMFEGKLTLTEWEAVLTELAEGKGKPRHTTEKEYWYWNRALRHLPDERKEMEKELGGEIRAQREKKRDTENKMPVKVKGAKSVNELEDDTFEKARYSLEEWMSMLERGDPYRDRNPNPEPLPGEIPQGGGYHIEETSSNIPTSPEKWAKAKSAARSKFKVYPSAYANLWAAKKYKSMGGGWKKGKK